MLHFVILNFVTQLNTNDHSGSQIASGVVVRRQQRYDVGGNITRLALNFPNYHHQ